MATALLQGITLKGVSSCVPAKVFNNVEDSENFDPKDIKKVVAMAGIKKRRIVDEATCSSDLCIHAAKVLLKELDWHRDSIDALIFVSQTPDYFLPSTSCIIHRDLEMSESCATFDVGLGCSGYPYGLWLGAMMLQTNSAKRVLVLHGETPSRFTHPEDRSTVLLFGDAGSATAIEAGGEETWGFSLHSDGKGYADLIIPGRGFRDPVPNDARDNYLHMNGTNLFNFTVKKVPTLIEETLTLMNCQLEAVDSFIFHQSNEFIMRHIAKKCHLPLEKIPIILSEFGNTGGPSVPLTLAKHYLDNPIAGTEKTLLLGYGVGLSWGSTLMDLSSDTLFLHSTTG